MMDFGFLWKRRAAFYLKEAIGYTRYIANSGSIAFLVLGVTGAAFYYSQLLRELPTTFPIEWGMALLFAFLLAKGRIRTFIKEADLVFLLPAEEKLSRYFKFAFGYSLLAQSVILYLFLLVLWPLYIHRMGDAALSFSLVFILLAVLKGFHLLAAWQEMRFVQRRKLTFHAWVRGLVSFPLIYFFFTRGLSLIWIGGILGILVVSFLYYRSVHRLHLLNWQQLIQEEMKVMSRFYRFVNSFVDVPGFQTKVYRRNWLCGITNRLSFTQKNTYIYLMLKSFIRSDLLGMVFRIAIIGFLVVFFLPGDWGKGTAYGIFLYLAAIQLAALGQIHGHVFWFYLYPIDPGQRKAALKTVSTWALAAIGILLWIPLVFRFQSLYLPLVGIFLGFIMVFFLRKRKPMKD